MRPEAKAAGGGRGMSDRDALMKEKNELVQKMLEMQKKFAELEHTQGIEPKAYYAPDPATYLNEYRREYQALATRVNKLAHEINGSGHIH
jgi:chromosome segregation ATPase